MDGDDIMLLPRLEKQVALLATEPSVGIASCGVASFSDGEIGEGYRHDAWLNGLVSHEAIYRARYIESPLAHPTAVMRRHILESYGGYRDMGWPEDYDLWLRLLESGVRFQKVPEVPCVGETNPTAHHASTLPTAPKLFLDCKVAHLIDGPLRGVSKCCDLGGRALGWTPWQAPHAGGLQGGVFC